MPAYADEQRIEALKALEECKGSVSKAIKRLGYPTGQTFYSWINQDCAYNTRETGRPWAHYDPQIKELAVKMLNDGHTGKDAAAVLGVSSSAVIYNRARRVDKPPKVGKRPGMETRPRAQKDGGHAYDGFDGDLAHKIEMLELENDVLREVVGVLKAKSLSEMENAEKTQTIDLLRAKTERSLRGLAAFLKISKSSYEYQHARLSAKDKYEKLRDKVVGIFEAADCARGHRYVTHVLRSGDDPIAVSERVVRRLMRERGCRVIYIKKARRHGSYEGEVSDAPDDLVRRDSRAGAPEKPWPTDITGFSLPCGKCYLSPALDCFDGKAASWSASTQPDAALAKRQPEKACHGLSSHGATIMHSDRGGHYRWPGRISICERHGLLRSMSKRGRSPDDSAMEGFFGRLKNEFFYHRDRRGVSMSKFMGMLSAYIKYYNEERLKEGLGWMSPNQRRRSLGITV